MTATATPFLTPTPEGQVGIYLVTPTATAFRTPTPSATPRPPITHLSAGSRVTLTEIQMIGAREGWAFGGIPGQDVHLLRTSDGGETWRDVSPAVPGAEPGENLAAAGAFLDEHTARVLFYLPRPESGQTQPLHVWQTQDGGATWLKSHAGDTYFIGLDGLVPLVRFVDRDHGWILIRYGGIGMHKHPVDLLVTADGEAWAWRLDYMSSELLSCTKSGVAFGGAQVGFATIGQCPIDGVELDWTYDGGTTWEGRTLSLPPDQPDLGACDAHSPQFVSSWAFAAADCRTSAGWEPVGLLFSSRDEGSTWETLPYPGGALLFIDPQTGWALSRDIYKTTDAGHSWEWVKTVNWDGQFSFVSPSLGWAVARADGEVALVRTADGGASWQLLQPVIGP